MMRTTMAIGKGRASKGLRKAFLRFRDECIWIGGCFEMFGAVFRPPHQPADLLNRTAPLFFSDLQRILIEYWFLQACRITDPAGSGDRESLTVDNLNRQLRAEGLLTRSIEKAAAGVQRYRRFVANARNKRVAHFDKRAALSRRTKGAHKEKEVAAFLEHMQVYCDEVGRAVGVGPLAFMSTSGPGDAIDLLVFLRAGLKAKDAERRRAQATIIASAGPRARPAPR
jgi:hypothetical protein